MLFFHEDLIGPLAMVLLDLLFSVLNPLFKVEFHLFWGLHFLIWSRRCRLCRIDCVCLAGLICRVRALVSKIKCFILLLFLFLFKLSIVQSWMAPSLCLISLLHGQKRFVIRSLLQAWCAHIPFNYFVADTGEAHIIDGGKFEFVAGVDNFKVCSKIFFLAITDRDDFFFFDWS